MFDWFTSLLLCISWCLFDCCQFGGIGCACIKVQVIHDIERISNARSIIIFNSFLIFLIDWLLIEGVIRYLQVLALPVVLIYLLLLLFLRNFLLQLSFFFNQLIDQGSCISFGIDSMLRSWTSLKLRGLQTISLSWRSGFIDDNLIWRHVLI